MEENINIEDVSNAISFIAPLPGQGPNGRSLYPLGEIHDVGDVMDSFISALYKGYPVPFLEGEVNWMSGHDQDFFQDFFIRKFQFKGIDVEGHQISNKFTLMTLLSEVPAGTSNLSVHHLRDNLLFRLEIEVNIFAWKSNILYSEISF